MAKLGDLKIHARDSIVAAALAGVLTGLSERVSSSEVVGRLCVALETDGTAERQLIAQSLGRLAYDNPAARHDGEEFQKFGRAMRRWTWGPLIVKEDTATLLADNPDALALWRLNPIWNARRAIAEAMSARIFTEPLLDPAPSTEDDWTVQPEEN